ncbi:hypothetical protein AKO1_004456 [Acrasis kona]
MGAITVFWISVVKRSPIGRFIVKKFSNRNQDDVGPRWYFEWQDEVFKKIGGLLALILSFTPLLAISIASSKFLIYILGRFVFTNGTVTTIALVQTAAVVGIAFYILTSRSSLLESLPFQFFLTVVMLILPIVLLIVFSMLCVNFMQDSAWSSYAELFAWCYCLLECLFYEHFSCALHDMYRIRIMKSFFHGGRDVSLSELGSPSESRNVQKTGNHRLLYLANTCLNNYEPMRRDLYPRRYHSFTISQLHMGSVVTGYTIMDDMTTSSAMSISGAVLAINLGTLDRLYSTFFTRFTLAVLSLNLASYISLYRVTLLKVVAHLATIINVILSVAAFVTFAVGYYDEEMARYDVLQILIIVLVTWPIVCAVIIEAIFYLFLLVQSCIHGDKNINYRRVENSRWTMIRRWPINDLPIWRSVTQVLGICEVRSVRNVYCTDGGHFDNLGIYPLLQRRVKNILCFDGSQDKYYTLNDLYATLSIAERDGLIISCSYDKREDEQVDLLEPINIFKNDSASLKLTKDNHIQFTVKYSDNQEGKITYAKATLKGGEFLMVKLHALGDRTFPNITTADQWFTQDLFDAYRLLGKFVAGCAIPTFLGSTGMENK